MARRRSIWVNHAFEKDLAAGTTQLSDLGADVRTSLGISNLGGYTEVRVLGTITYLPDTPVDDISNVAVGIARGSEAAVSAIAGIQDPTGNGGDWQYLTQRYVIGNAVEVASGVFVPLGASWDLDMRSGRKMAEDFTLYIAMQTEVASLMGVSLRSLWLYP